VQAPPTFFQPLVSRGLDRCVRLPAAQAWMAILLLADLAAIGDLLTGEELWFGPVYLLVISLATWTLGWRAGQAVGLGCMALTLALNGASLYPYSGAELAWNAAIRFTAISLVVAVIAGARRAYLREWWLARTDILTGALNRQAFFELGESLAAVSRWRLLLYADLDGLKTINDRRGHAAGDACLKTYADNMRTAIRREDLFARVGGDEFLVFMAVKDEAAARSVATRLHGEMNAIPTGGGSALRCSVGALLVPPGAMAIDELVRQADDLMYRAKQRGAGLEMEPATACDVAAAGRARATLRAAAVLAARGGAHRGKPLGDRRGAIGARRLGDLRAPR
jgi:diguanylate cyclase (GGDEF)-like protein